MDGYLNKDGASFHPGEVYVNLEFTAGTSGAVPSKLTRSAGIASVVLTATGIYTVTFRDNYVSLIKADVDIWQATYDVTHAGKVVIKPAEVLPHAAGGATVALRCYTTNGVATAAALTSGDILQARFTFARILGSY